ncbi:hypothetical protein SAMN04487949_3605 [Halogranum gelatinilyticum]|uniref:Uncharacterized protein n=1 Tax=Halogranum gelatinilyticum TaxID=660521 RepID=A0A1G9ZD06_9EURY|nr:hypothetical protein SAMN04487949_3605 [Halogranum gelatinilyticum]
MAGKTQLGPRVEGDLADKYRNFVRFVNDGTYKGRLGDEVEKALKYQMALYFVRHPEELDRAANSDFIEDDDFVSDMMSLIDTMGPHIVAAADNLRPDDDYRSEPPRRERTYQPSVDSIPASEQLLRSTTADNEDDVMRRIERLERLLEENLSDDT